MLIGISGYIGSGKDTVAKIVNYLLTGGEKTYVDLEGFLEYYNDGVDKYPWEIKKFAYKLKQMASLLTGIPVEDFEKEEVKNSVLPKEWNYRGGFSVDYLERKMTVRQLLQKLGTEAVRDKVHTNAWVNALFADYKPLNQSATGRMTVEYPETSVDFIHNETYDGPIENYLKFPNWIISDMRFPNEYDAIKERGGITIRVNRRLFEGVDVEFKRHSSETSLDHIDDWDYIINNNGSLEDLLAEVKDILTWQKLLKTS